MKPYTFGIPRLLGWCELNFVKIEIMLEIILKKFISFLLSYFLSDQRLNCKVLPHSWPCLRIPLQVSCHFGHPHWTPFIYLCTWVTDIIGVLYKCYTRLLWNGKTEIYVYLWIFNVYAFLSGNDSLSKQVQLKMNGVGRMSYILNLFITKSFVSSSFRHRPKSETRQNKFFFFD